MTYVNRSRKSGARIIRIRACRRHRPVPTAVAWTSPVRYVETFIARLSEKERNRYFLPVPLGWTGTPQEYASLAVYLASDEHYLVGQAISPNGGAVI